MSANQRRHSAGRGRKTRARIERQVRACYATWAGDYYDNYYGAGAAYPPVHRALIRRWLVQAKVRRLLDAGCGPGSFLRDLPSRKMELFGFDVTSEMIDEARRVLTPKHVPPGNLWEGSVLDPASFRPPTRRRQTQFDAATCVGVFPHIPSGSEAEVLANLRGAVVKGGLVVVEARNQFFSMFTLNRYSYDFFLNELIGAADLERRAGSEAPAVRGAVEVLSQRFRMDLPPRRTGESGQPGYDEILSRTHHPFALKDTMVAAGFTDVRLVFYHHHCLPPMFESALPAVFRRESLRMDARPDWRGCFMASAFLLAGRRR